MDSLLANYASSEEEEQEQSPPRVPPAKPVKLEAKAEQEKDEDSLSKSTSKRGAIFDFLPPPKSSLFNSLPQPKSQSLPKPESQAELGHQKAVGERDEEILENSKPKLSSSFSSSLFSSLPAPKSTSSSSSSASKRVVQFRPPMVFNPYASGGDDKEDDDADEDEKERERKRSKEAISTSSPASFFSSMPAPKHSATLGAMPSASSTGRRSILETDNAASSASTGSAAGSDAVDSSVGHFKDQSSEMSYDYSSWSSGIESHAHYNGYCAASDGTAGSAGTDAGVNSDIGHMGDQSHDIYHHSSSLGGDSYAYYSGYGVGPGVASSTAGSDAGVDYSNAGSYESVDYSSGNGHVGYQNFSGSYGDYGNNAQYENNWANATALPEASSLVGHALQVPGKRGRKDAPSEIVEVKQDELMKNRPREDQVKLTGIAFGPAYQPTSTKGKPTKLHKRKHQIGSLYFDMKQKETELAERRSKGFLTKAQTQAKYGW